MYTFSKLGQHGRLGNQLFQIASTLGIAHYHQDFAVFPKWEYHMHFPKVPFESNPNEFYLTYVEKETKFHWPSLSPAYNWDLFGYFQSYKYFEADDFLIRKIFDLQIDGIIDVVSIHVRRGDYLGLQHLFPNLVETKYYEWAIAQFNKGTQFLVFSDDIPFCKSYFKGDQFSFYENENVIQTLRVMSSCKSNIIANSSFSWWAGYLNKNPDKLVVAPKQWTAFELEDDVIPKGWLRV